MNLRNAYNSNDNITCQDLLLLLSKPITINT
jgi:hypothetical protein